MSMMSFLQWITPEAHGLQTTIGVKHHSNFYFYVKVRDTVELIGVLPGVSGFSRVRASEVKAWICLCRRCSSTWTTLFLKHVYVLLIFKGFCLAQSVRRLHRGKSKRTSVEITKWHWSQLRLFWRFQFCMLSTFSLTFVTIITDIVAFLTTKMSQVK